MTNIEDTLVQMRRNPRGIRFNELCKICNYFQTQKNEGIALHDAWHDIPLINSQAKERMGYDTQKPLKLLTRIIVASSNPGEVVFDSFCGCETALESAHTLGRRWIGCDIAIHAIKRVARARLEERCGLLEGRDFVIEGVPRTLEGAKDL